MCLDCFDDPLVQWQKLLMAETEVLCWSDGDLCHVKRLCQEAEELFNPWLSSFDQTFSTKHRWCQSSSKLFCCVSSVPEDCHGDVLKASWFLGATNDESFLKLSFHIDAERCCYSFFWSFSSLAFFSLYSKRFVWQSSVEDPTLVHVENIARLIARDNAWQFPKPFVHIHLVDTSTFTTYLGTVNVVSDLESAQPSIWRLTFTFSNGLCKRNGLGLNHRSRHWNGHSSCSLEPFPCHLVNVVMLSCRADSFLFTGRIFLKCCHVFCFSFQNLLHLGLTNLENLSQGSLRLPLTLFYQLNLFLQGQFSSFWWLGHASKMQWFHELYTQSNNFQMIRSYYWKSFHPGVTVDQAEGLCHRIT